MVPIFVYCFLFVLLFKINILIFKESFKLSWGSIDLLGRNTIPIINDNNNIMLSFSTTLSLYYLFFYPICLN